MKAEKVKWEKVNGERMRKKMYFLLTFFFFFLFPFSFSLFAQSPQQTFEQANQAYFSQNFTEAISLYQKLEESGLQSADLFFNLANAYYRKGEIGEAVYYYMKALRYAPRDRDLVANYRYVLSKRVEVSEQSLSEKAEDLFFFLKNLLTLREMLGLTLILYWILFGVGIAYYLKRKKSWGIVLAVMLFCNLYVIPVAFRKFQQEHLQKTAVILNSTVPVYSEPNAESIRLFDLREGALAQVKDQREGFVKLRYKKGQIGWVKLDQLKIL